MQLLNVRDYQSWSSYDYDKEETNYIVINTLKKLSPQIECFFREFEKFLGWHICVEDDA